MRQHGINRKHGWQPASFGGWQLESDFAWNRRNRNNFNESIRNARPNGRNGDGSVTGTALNDNDRESRK